MEIHHIPGGSPSSSTSSSSDPNHKSTTRNGGYHHQNHLENNNHHHHHATPNNADDPMHSWWESISKARARIHLLSSLLPTADPPLSSLADSDRPARSLLSSTAAYAAVSSSLSSPSSGSGDDPLCNWLYDTYLSSDLDLRLVVLAFIPLLSGLYLSRVHSLSSTSLAGFEAVFLALYSSETKSRAGKPVLISIPDLSQPSLYHTPRADSSTTSTKHGAPNSSTTSIKQSHSSTTSVGVLSPSLEPQTVLKSSKRAIIVGVALDCYYKQISHMPSWSKLDFCKFASYWAGQDCPCKSEFDPNPEDSVINSFSDGMIRVEENGDGIVEGAMRRLDINGDSEIVVVEGTRIPLPWELLQPVLRILGHCLLAPLNSSDVKDAASSAVQCLYARASHDLVPQAILATRSLIQLDKRNREAAQAVEVANAASNTNTPSKAKKPEILLVSK